jgi:hypothetical protein
MELKIADAILVAVPFSKALKSWAKADPSVMAALKFSNDDRFTPLPMIRFYRSKLRPNDRILGFSVWDSIAKRFKQDYVLDVGDKDKEFILYTAPGVPDTPVVRHISELFEQYDDKGDQKKGELERDHYKTVDEFHDYTVSANSSWLWEKAQWAMKVGSVKKRKPTQAELKFAIRSMEEEIDRKTSD